jgi:hypothetical protein
MYSALNLANTLIAQRWGHRVMSNFYYGSMGYMMVNQFKFDKMFDILGPGKITKFNPEDYEGCKRVPGIALKGDEFKHDGGKLQWGLLPFQQVKHVVRVLMFGADKYGKRSWHKVPNARERYFDALMRHILAWKNGDKTDNESGLLTLAHAGCCLLFLMWFDDEDNDKC